MIQAVRCFLEFCYHVWQEVIDDNDLDKLNELLTKFHKKREVFWEVGMRPKGFNLPWQHALTHYHDLITEFGTPNGLCSSITESQHIEDIKDPYWCSNWNEPLSQMLTTNQCMDKLSAQHIDYVAQGMLKDSIFQGCIEVPQKVVADSCTALGPWEDDNGGAVEHHKGIAGEVLMACTAGALNIMA